LPKLCEASQVKESLPERKEITPRDKSIWSPFVVTEKNENEKSLDNPSPHAEKIRNHNTQFVSGVKRVEYINFLYEDSKLLVPCAEQSLMKLICQIGMIYNPLELQFRKVFHIPNIEEEIDKGIVTLKQQLKTEELDSRDITILIDRACVYIRHKNWIEAMQEFEKILKRLRPLNIRYLIRLIDKAKEAADLIKGKNIIFFLGGTGSGKSTIIHALAGSKMEAKEVNGLCHISPVGPFKNRALEAMTSNPNAESGTRSITPVTIQYSDVGGNSLGEVVLCDTPGFEDTDEPEIDIANMIGIVQAAQLSKSVKPVLLVSYKAVGDRLTGIKNLARNIISMIPSIEQHMKAFSYIFTKFPKAERDRIHASLVDLTKHLKPEEIDDKCYMTFHDDMVKKTRKGAIVIDPLNINPGELLDDLADTPAMEYPDRVFQKSITEKSKTVLNEACNKHQSAIIIACKNHNYEYACMRLDELKTLYEILEQDSINQVYKLCIGYAAKHLMAEYQTAISTFKRSFTDQNELTNDDINQYIQYSP